MRTRTCVWKLTGKTPADGDLDPNAIHGLRLDALQSFFGASAGFD
ncbi:MAG: hypothetical protein ACR2I2_14215 [Bryobacteraceae bacterium]